MTPIGAGAKLARAMVVLIIVIITGFAFSRVDQPLRIDTDLKNLSPALSNDEGMQGAVSALSRSLESRMMLVLASEDPDLPSVVAAEVADSLGSAQDIEVTVGNALPTSLVTLFADHRFQLLDENQRQTLAQVSDQTLIDRATARLYELADSGRILPFEQDPLGWFNDYITGLADSEQPPPETANETTAVVHLNLGDGALDRDFQAQFSATLKTTTDRIESSYPAITIYRSGIFLFAEQAASTARRDISLISTVSSIAVILLMLLAFRSLRPMMLAILSIVIGIGFAFVASHLLHGKVHIITLVFGVGLIGIVIDYALHYSYHQTWSNQGAGKRTLYSAMALSLGSSMIGYGALGFSELPALGRVALFSCIGLITSWLCVVALGPWLGRGKPTHQSRLIASSTNAIRNLASALAGRPRFLIVAIGLSMVALVFAGVRSDDNPRALFEPDPALVAQEIAVAERTNRFEPGQYFIVRGNDEADLFDHILALETAASDDALFSIADFLPSPSDQRTNYQAQQRLYQPDGVASQFLSALGAEDDMAIALASEYQSAGGRLLTARQFSDATGNQIPPLVLVQDGELFSFVLVVDVDAIGQAKALAGDTPEIEFIDTASMTATALGNQRRGALALLGLGFGMISLLLVLRYRSLRALGLLLVPGASILAVLIVFAVTGIGLTLFHTMALFLVLGLGMDYVIFSAELRSARTITSQAVFLSALTSLLSFGLLALSSMPVVEAFGQTMLIGNLFNLLGSLIYAATLERYPSLDFVRPGDTS